MEETEKQQPKEETKEVPESKKSTVEEKLSEEKREQQPPKEKPNLGDFKNLTDLINSHKQNIREIIPEIRDYIKNVINGSPLKEKYNILFIYLKGGSISNFTRDKFYSSLSKIDKGKDLLVIIRSLGGQVEPAYFISKCCKEYSKKFIVTIPREAKSAATLISLGADEIHMGNMSELGPIDPQIEGKEIGLVSALSLRNAIEYLASLTRKYPDSSSMFAQFLIKKLELQTLGHFERIPESAKDYAIRLLQDKMFPGGLFPADIAHKLVYEYKDHGFVIGKDEAKSILGEGIVKQFTPEYDLGAKICDFLEMLDLGLWIYYKDKPYQFMIIGDLENFFLFIR